MSFSYDLPFSQPETRSPKAPVVDGKSMINSEQLSYPWSSSFDDSDPSPDADVDDVSADDDSRWDVFLPDDDEIDPLPEPGDFWAGDD
jgi:hypothetical protein